MTGTPWLISRDSKPDAIIDLYCFAHAGGVPGEYARWSGGLPGVRVWGVQPPGSGSRTRERPFTAMRPLVNAVVDAVDFTPPFALFGHSMGGLVAFEVARRLRDLDRPLPRRLFISATPPPPLAGRRIPLHTLPDDELLDEVGRRWGPLPPEILGDPRFRKLVAGRYRADFAVFETYDYVPANPLGCPITAFAGDAERDVLGLERWAGQTDAGFSLHVLPGGHFYLRDQRVPLLGLVKAELAGDLVTQNGNYR